MTPGFTVQFSGPLLHKVVEEKRIKNSTYVPVPGKLVDFATFWSIVAKVYTASKKDQLKADASLAKAHSPDGLRAMCDVELGRVVRTHDAAIRAAEIERATYEIAIATREARLPSRTSSRRATRSSTSAATRAPQSLSSRRSTSAQLRSARSSR
jgi:hypothetical protein